MIFTAILLTILILILLLSYYTYRTAFYSNRARHAKPDTPIAGKQYEEVAGNLSRISHIMEQYSYEPVTILSHDGLKLFGRYYHFRDGAPLVLLMHGYRSHAFRDCSGGHALSRKMGYNALVVDQRAHGGSDGKTITFGIKERRDCLEWIKFVNQRFGNETPIILSGLSMGAATVLMASELDLPENVVGIMADSPYSSPAAIIEKVCRDIHYPVTLCRPFIYLGAMIYGGMKLDECSAKVAVSHAKVPILLLHGEADHFVPCGMSREIAACCASPVELHTFPEAGHGLCYMIDPRRYERVVYEFLNAIPALEGTVSKEFVNQLHL